MEHLRMRLVQRFLLCSILALIAVRAHAHAVQEGEAAMLHNMKSAPTISSWHRLEVWTRVAAVILR